MKIRQDCLQIRGRLVHFHALLEKNRITLIDGGFLGNPIKRVARVLARHNRSVEEISHIVVSHGHIDHTLSLQKWKEQTNAVILAPEKDRIQIRGEYPYRGLNRLCGYMEGCTRALFRFQPPVIDRWFHPGEKLGLWDDLEVVPFPGHTVGHCGFYSPSRKFLIANDLFSNFLGLTGPPPPWFNIDQKEIRESIVKAAELDISGGVTLNHCRPASAGGHRDDLLKLAKRLRK